MSAATDNRPSLRERRRVETRAEIADAARALFAERGYQATRTSDIGDRAGVSDATLFRYFASKPGIALAAVTERVDLVLAHLADQPSDRGDLEAARAVLADDAALGPLRPRRPPLSVRSCSSLPPRTSGPRSTPPSTRRPPPLRGSSPNATGGRPRCCEIVSTATPSSEPYKLRRPPGSTTRTGHHSPRPSPRPSIGSAV